MILRHNWIWIDWLLGALFLSWFVIGSAILLLRPDLLGSAPRLPIVLGMLLDLILPLAFWHPGYVQTALFPAAVLLTAGPLQFYLNYKSHQDLIIITIPLLIIGYLADRYNIWWTFPVFTIGFPVAIFLFAEHQFAVSTLIDQISSSALFFGIGLAIQRIMSANLRMQKLLEENSKQYDLIREQNRVLEQYAEHVEKLTLAEERNRLARDLHDTVGHTFTSVIMGMDAVACLLEATPDQAREKLEVLRRVTRTGLEEVRRSIHQIAPPTEEGTLAQQLGMLAGEFALHTGTEVGFHQSGAEQEPSGQLKLTLIRCLQEALTNAKRHGQAHSISVSLEFSAGAVTLTVADDGSGAEVLQAGFGLTAMKERIEALQGTFEASTAPGAGTVLRCRVPLGHG